MSSHDNEKEGRRPSISKASFVLLVMESPRLEKGDLPWLEPDYFSEDDSELNYFHYRTHFEDKRKQWQDGDKVCNF